MVSKVGLAGDYVDNLSPADREMYIMYYKEEEDKKKKKESGPNQIPLSPIDTMGK